MRRQRQFRIIAGALAGGVAASAAALALALPAAPWGAAIEPVEPPPRSAFATASIESGANLAAIGNCAGCHTARAGAPYAGGVAVHTPFGTVFASNVTPDPGTGIGRWSQAAFTRALREGLARDGSHLYPAFPYDHFTHGSDADIAALYAYLMTRTPVQATTPRNELRFPFNFRTLVAGWNLLFLRRGADDPSVPTDPRRSAEWNRGAYLTEALAHCGACHTPRNTLGAEQRRRAFDGGSAEGWYAPPLDAASPSPQPWDVAALTEYLRSGLAADHAIAGGPMQGVSASLAEASRDDVQAIAVYIVSLMGEPTDERQRRADASRLRAQQPLAAPGPVASTDVPPSADNAQQRLGATVYASTCASCHDLGRGASSNAALRLPLAVALYDADPRTLLHIVRDGIAPGDAARGRVMPAFGSALTDAQLTALAAYLRRRAAAAPPWPDLAQAVRESRSSLTAHEEN